MKKVLYITNLPAPYKVLFFKKIGLKVDLTVMYESDSDIERDKSWFDYSVQNFNVIYIKEFGNKIKKNFLKYLHEEKFEKIVISCYSTSFERMAIRLFKKRHIPYVISSDGGFIKNDNIFKKMIKKFYLSGAECYFSPNEVTDKYLRYYGATSKIYRYPFTSVTNDDIHEFQIFSRVADNKYELRKKLGILEDRVVVGVGSFTFRKGWDILLNSISDTNVGYYIIGGKPQKDYLDIVAQRDLTNVHFVEFCDKERVYNYYRAADVFCLPTREDIWGLVVNEAMANGLPVITTFECNAGLSLVKEGYNGYLFEAKSKNAIGQLSYLLHKILYNDDISKLSANSIKIISEYTIEKMADSYIEVLQ